MLPAARVAFLQHEAACVHCMARGARRCEASWNSLKLNRQRPCTLCLSERELWNKLVWKELANSKRTGATLHSHSAGDQGPLKMRRNANSLRAQRLLSPLLTLFKLLSKNFYFFESTN